jgi:hypothetical protein
MEFQSVHDLARNWAETKVRTRDSHLALNLAIHWDILLVEHLVYCLESPLVDCLVQKLVVRLAVNSVDSSEPQSASWSDNEMVVYYQDRLVLATAGYLVFPMDYKTAVK